MPHEQAARWLREVPHSESIETTAGASATVEGDAIVVRDPKGAVVVTYDAVTGSATIAAPSGDLRLCAPEGRVVVEAGKDIALSSRTKATIQAVELDLSADLMHLRSKAIDLASGALQASVTQASLGVGLCRVQAERLLQRARDVYQDVQGTLETRAGRIRAVVQGPVQVRSESTSIVSKDDTFIDGRRVLLG